MDDLYLYRAEQQTGPYTEAEARALVASSQINRTCLAWREGMPEWLPLEQVVTLLKPPPPPPMAVSRGSTIPPGLPPVPRRLVRIEPPTPIKPAENKQPETDRWAVFRLPGVKYGLRVVIIFAIVIIRSQCQHH